MEDVAKIKPNTATLTRTVGRPLAAPLQAASSRAVPATLGVVLVDRRQRSEVALDRPRELLGVRDDLRGSSACARALAPRLPAGRQLPSAAREPRPPAAPHEHTAATSRTMANDTHAAKDTARATFLSATPGTLDDMVRRLANPRARRPRADGLRRQHDPRRPRRPRRRTRRPRRRRAPTARPSRTFFFRGGALVTGPASSRAGHAGGRTRRARAPCSRARRPAPRRRSRSGRRSARRRDPGRPRDRDLLGRTRQPTRAPRARSSARSPSSRRSGRVSIDVARHSRSRSRTAPATTLTRPATAADYVDLTADALIFVRTPGARLDRLEPGRARRHRDSLRGHVPGRGPAGGKLVPRRRSPRASGAPERGHVVDEAALPAGRRDARLLRGLGRGRLASARDRRSRSTSVLDRTASPGRPRLQCAAARSPVAQLAERSAVNRNVVGSSPTRGAG